MELKLSDLQQMIANVVAEQMKSAEHERKMAEDRGEADDPLVEERIERMVNERTEKAVAEATAKVREEMERRMAEARAIDTDAIPDATSLLVTRGADIVRKPVEECNEIEREAQKLHDVLYTISKVAARPESVMRNYLLSKRSDADIVTRALDTYTSGAGAEWVNAAYSNQFVEAILKGGVLAPLFPRFQMTAHTVYVPTVGGRMAAYLTSGAENQAVTEDTALTSGRVTFTAKELNIYKAYSDALDEDSVASIGPLLVAQMQASISEWLDMAIDSGDTSTTHMDSDVTASTDPRKAWIGLRKKALTDNGANVSLGTFNFDTLVTIPANMGVYSNNPKDLVWIVPTKIYWSKLFTLKDANNNPVWLPANGIAGPNPIISGQVAWLAGIPVVTSGVVRTNLNATGVYDGSTTSKSVLYCVYTDGFWLGDRHLVTVETQRQAKSRSTDVVLTWRGDFHCVRGTEVVVGMGYNL